MCIRDRVFRPGSTMKACTEPNKPVSSRSLGGILKSPAMTKGMARPARRSHRPAMMRQFSSPMPS
eukprot:7802644-Lingulodinium_polyedra.AAC.1